MRLLPTNDVSWTLSLGGGKHGTHLYKSVYAFGRLGRELFQPDPLWGLLPVIESDLMSGRIQWGSITRVRVI